eukprot:CAMPEP_0172530158 /NCGR_PEP_ID=MMETSP1067-20121228/3982_1 /TAXON_ID=265564 ORGANISM="Thalassiosira punctigera, Strain Tpunct2005C2" /NCGR_SAMPLE_ID=MMETSP1067 /ASSEMBLY_ACC=CAM_ASM_000444 /LENGTH=624 /DNA_ID=CAMNT_0013314311 /DNA_START=175 /DNA_END=2049 /DNA_ORIENTATION=+
MNASALRMSMASRRAFQPSVRGLLERRTTSAFAAATVGSSPVLNFYAANNTGAAKSYFSTKKDFPDDMTREPSQGLPDYLEHWNRDNFRKVGYGLAAASALSIPAGQIFLSTALSATTAGYWYLGLQDIGSKQSIRRNFPVLGRIRYILESIRPEIRQYFIEADDDALPFSRLDRAMVYRRAKDANSSMPFGTKGDTNAVGYEWVNHSMYPTHLGEQRVMIGANNAWCKQPYSSSLLNISAMSYGALSDKAILALSSGAKLGGFSHNTGEGGISRFHKEGGADIVWNIGTAYFGCGTFNDKGERVFDPEVFKENVQHVKMVEIKLSQGAKPAHGGMLPKEKITPLIAEARNLPYPTELDCNSPPKHSAFSNPHEMCQFIAELRELSGGKPIGFKFCVGQPEEFTALVHAFIETGIHPDFITVDGGEGGTGAAPPEFSNGIGTPLAEGLSFVHAVLVGAGFRDPHDKTKSKIVIIASGKHLTGMSLFKSFALGADVANAARAFMFSLGCIQALKCNTNICPTGIATQNPDLTWGLDPKSKQVRVANFHKKTVEVAVEVMEAAGVNSWSEIHPYMVVKRVGAGQSKDYREIYQHLQVKKGELLEGKGPRRLLEAWDLDDGIIARVV